MTADRQRQVAEVLAGLSVSVDRDSHIRPSFAPHLAAALAPLIGQWREQDRAEGARLARAEELVEVGRAFSSLDTLAFSDWLIDRTRAAKAEWRDRAAALREGQASDTDGRASPQNGPGATNGP